MLRFTPEEDAALLPYVSRVCDWSKVMPHLSRSIGAARRRLYLLRRHAQTSWQIDQREKATWPLPAAQMEAHRARARAMRRRSDGRFA